MPRKCGNISKDEEDMDDLSETDYYPGVQDLIKQLKDKVKKPPYLFLILQLGSNEVRSLYEKSAIYNTVTNA